MVGKNSKVLFHFHRLSEYLVQCKHCDRTLSSKHTSSNLTRHLIRNHKLLARKIFAGDEGRMLAELKEELASAEGINIDHTEEGEIKDAVHTITGHSSSEPEMRNKIIGKNNKLWAHFHPMSEFMAKCKHCGKTLSSKHSSSNLMRHIVRRHPDFTKSFSSARQQITTKKEAVILTVDRQSGDPLEKLDFDDVDSIIEKVDHMDDEEPFYEYVVDNTDEGGLKSCDHDVKRGIQIIDNTACATDTASFIEPSTQLNEKLKAETTYYNEMAELARAKRRLIDLQTKKLLIELSAVEN